MKIKLETVKAVGQAIDKLGKSRESLDQEVHRVAVQCLAHYQESRDSTLLLRLIGGKSIRREKGQKGYTVTAEHPGVLGSLRGFVIDWLATYSDLRFNGQEGYIYRLNPKSRAYAEHVQKLGGVVDADKAEADPWWNGREAKRNATRGSIDLLTLVKRVQGLPEMINRALEQEAEGEGDRIADDQVGHMRDLADLLNRQTMAFLTSRGLDVASLEAARAARKAATATVTQPVEDKPAVTEAA